MYIFKPPSVKENPMGKGRLLFRFLTPQGITVAKLGNKYHELRSPTTDELESYDVFYLGGYVHVVSEEEKTSLESAGYEVIEI